MLTRISPFLQSQGHKQKGHHETLRRNAHGGKFCAGCFENGTDPRCGWTAETPRDLP